MRTTILFILFIFQQTAITANAKMECVLKALYDRIELSPAAREAAMRHAKEQDFGLDPSRIASTNAGLLAKNDFRTQFELEALLTSLRQLPFQFKQIVSDCDLSVKKLHDICEKLFPETGCEIFDGLIVARKCNKHYMNVNYSLCVPECPTNLLDVESDPFICAKTYIGASQPQASEESLPNGSRPLAWDCPEDYTSVSYGICAKECPIGWVDIGKACEKPTVQLRDHEIFYYRFDLDEEAN